MRLVELQAEGRIGKRVFRPAVVRFRGDASRLCRHTIATAWNPCPGDAAAWSSLARGVRDRGEIVIRGNPATRGAPGTLGHNAGSKTRRHDGDEEQRPQPISHGARIISEAATGTL